MKKDADSQDKKGKVVTLSSKKMARGKAKNSQSAGKNHNISNNTFVTDSRFHRAMDLVREDMNNALSNSSNANNSFYFLLRFLIEKNIINREEFEEFVAKEIDGAPMQYGDEEDE